MVKGFKRIDMGKSMNRPKLKIKNLYKIFGPRGGSFIDPVKNGISKQELLDNHGHVLGSVSYTHLTLPTIFRV